MSASTRIVVCAMALLLVLTASPPASAREGEGLNWAFQDTGIAMGGSYSTAVAMRNDRAWPVIFTDVPVGSAFTLFPGTPSGGPGPWAGPGNWQSIGSNLMLRRPSRMRASTSPDGRVLVTGSYATSEGAGGSVSNATAGWTLLPASTRAAAFGADGTLYTATSNTVSSGSRYTGGPIMDIAVSSAGDIGVLDVSMRYWHFSPWLGAWLNTNLATLGPVPMPDSIDLEFDARNRPHVVGTAGPNVVAYDFSTITGTWSMTTMGASLSGGAFLALAADSEGTVGTAWVGYPDGRLTYAYKDDNGPWTTSMVTSQISTSQRLVGIAYDYDNRPVLSYLGQDGRIYLAYDPIMVIPEPTAVCAVMLSGLMLIRRRGR